MIQNISRFTNYNVQANNNSNYRQNAQKNSPINADTVSFTGGKGIKYVEEGILNMLQLLEKEPPVIGFKGDGKWLLPNLRHGAGKRFNLYMPNGEQLSYQRGSFNDNVVFTLKRNGGEGNAVSKINIPGQDENLESKRLLKKKMDNILTFRVSTQDSKYSYNQFKAGQIDKLVANSDGSFSEVSALSDAEYSQIHKILKENLPDFF